MSEPLVSVLMPLYNSQAYVAEAIESVCRENYANIELLICDDASTDDSLAIARDCAAREPRIRLFTREQNSGSVSIVYRSLAEAVRGKYLIASDSDDVAMPRRLETLVSLAERHPETSLVYGTVYVVSQDLATRLGVYATPFCPFRLFRNNFIPDGGALIRKAAYDAVGGYDPKVKWAEDYELRLRLATFGPMIHTDKLVYLYRHHSESWTARNLDIAEEESFKQNLLRREKATVERIRTGRITCYRDAVIAAYYLAATDPTSPRSERHAFPHLAARLIHRSVGSVMYLLRIVAPKSVERLGRSVMYVASRIVKRFTRRAVQAWKRTPLFHPRITGSALTAALAEAGLRAGDQAMVHCSMSTIGWIIGGAPTVVDALTATVGEGGRLIMPTFTYQCDLGTSEPTAPPPAWQRYRPNLPCSREMGAVAEAFRCGAGTFRIHHPGLSLALWGNDAEGFAARHRLFDSFSPSSPLGELYPDAKIVMIGTTFETVTFLHLAEYLAEVPYQDYSHYFGMSDENNPVIRLRTTGASAAFTKFTGLLNSGLLHARTVTLGNSHVTVIQARELVDFAAKMLRYLPDFVLGETTTSCRERRQLLNAHAAAAALPFGSMRSGPTDAANWRANAVSQR